MSDADSVQVAIRIRPMVKSEYDRGCQKAVEKTPGIPQIAVNGGSDVFTFNYVFDEKNTQKDVYTNCVSDLMDKIFQGFNGTILAYGQTGSGKTHTMGTAFNGELNDHVGVIPRAMCEIFERIEKLAGEFEFVVTCSFMELYQEQLYDLLSHERKVVDIREDKNGIVMFGITELVVTSAKETTDCLVRGSGGRKTGATAMNEQSSRSHAIFTVTIQSTQKGDLNTVTTSKFHLVDLAGSERSKKTMADGERFKEGVKINQGLLALGNVISALGSNQGSGFVRYRDSKLTRLLQDSLGGNSITLMIACISPADYNVAETLSTLRYADRARKIKNKPIVNQDPHAAEIKRLNDIIRQLRLDLMAAGGTDSTSINGAIKSNGIDLKPEIKGKQFLELADKYRNLQQQLQATLSDLAESEMKAHIAEDANEKLKEKSEAMKSIINELTIDDLKSEELPQLQKRLHEMRALVEGLDEQLERTQSEMTVHKRRSASISEESDTDINHELMQQETDAYTSKQMEIKEQLRKINRELSLKEEFHQRVAVNLGKFSSLDDNIEEKVKECEQKIQELEAEKAELQDKLRHVKTNVPVKLAEERRKRLMQLEQELNDYKRKNSQQAKMLKLREQEKVKIQNLSSEIQVMKASKVKLIRTMRQESDNFRKWKLTREKELLHLKNNDRKLQNEMARKEAIHTKQRNVLKRKCEEAMAINKRLKDALERQSQAHTLRQKLQSNKDVTAATTKLDQVISCVERELEVIISLIDANHSLGELMEDRGIISNRIRELEDQSTRDSSLDQELTTLREDFEMRNAQITDLQHKVCAANLEKRMNSLADCIQSLPESRAIVKHLLKTINEMRNEFANCRQAEKAAFEEQRTLRETAESQCMFAAKRMRLMELAHEEAIAERENAYEDKIAVLLRELHNSAPQLADGAEITPEQLERQKIQEEQLNKFDDLKEELENYKKLLAQLQNPTKKSKMIKPLDMDTTIEEVLSSDDDEVDDDITYDPDWKKTPIVRRISKRKSADSFDETKPTKKMSCKCSGSCSNRRCLCVKNSVKCENCSCSDACKNKGGDEENAQNDSENISDIDDNRKFLQPYNVDDVAISPKVARLSNINNITFTTPIGKRRFFN